MNFPRARRGFTLIELMIVIAIVAILAAIAYPSYREQVVKTRRAEGKALLAEVSARLERCFTLHNAYNHADCAAAASADSDGGWYRVNADPLTAAAYVLHARPQRSQATDDTRCGTLTLSHVGQRGQTGSPPAGYDCW
jgi:type IV pilus assembly protein PilE